MPFLKSHFLIQRLFALMQFYIFPSALSIQALVHREPPTVTGQQRKMHTCWRNSRTRGPSVQAAADRARLGLRRHRIHELHLPGTGNVYL